MFSCLKHHLFCFMVKIRAFTQPIIHFTTLVFHLTFIFMLKLVLLFLVFIDAYS
jgi:hypothetical protein